MSTEPDPVPRVVVEILREARERKAWGDIRIEVRDGIVRRVFHERVVLVSGEGANAK